MNFLKELGELSRKYNVWIEAEPFKKGVAIYDTNQFDTVAHKLENDYDEYFCEVADND